MWTISGGIEEIFTSSGTYYVSWTSLLSTESMTFSQPSYTYKLSTITALNFLTIPASLLQTFTITASTWTLFNTFGASTGTYTFTPSLTPWPLTYNPCEPYLSLPSRILTLDPEWKSCSQSIKGLHDPPSFLNSENGFFPVTTTTPPRRPSGFLSVPTKAPESAAEETLAASAGQSVSQPIVTKTPLPSISMTSNGGEVVIGPSTQVFDPKYVIGTKTVSAGGPALTFDGMVISLMSVSGRERVVIGGANGQSWTEDVSVLTWTGTGTGLGNGLATVSVGGGESRAGKGGSGSTSGSGTGQGTVSVGGGGSGTGKGGSSSKSGSARMKVGVLLVCQIVFFCLAEFYAR